MIVKTPFRALIAGDVRGYRRVSLGRFGDPIPPAASYQLQSVAHPSWFLDNPDGLAGQIPGFADQYNQAISISAQVDAIRADPAAKSVVVLSDGLAKALATYMRNTAIYFEWSTEGLGFSRGASQQAKLTSAINSVKSTLAQYLSQVPPALQKAQAAIQARVDAATASAAANAAAQQAAADAQAAQAQQQTATSQASAAAAQAQAAQSSAAAQNAADQEAIAHANAQAALADATSTKVFGIPVSQLAIGGAVLFGGAWLLSKFDKKGGSGGAP